MGEISGISWGKALRYALECVLYFIPWMIIGGIIALMGLVMLTSLPSTEPLGETYTVKGLTGILLTIIGSIIMLFGFMASFFKVMSKLIAESRPQTSEQASPPP